MDRGDLPARSKRCQGQALVKRQSRFGSFDLLQQGFGFGMTGIISQNEPKYILRGVKALPIKIPLRLSKHACVFEGLVEASVTT